MDTKNNLLKFNGVVIGESNYREFDKLLTILTDEIGKIKVYAFNVRKQNSKNIGKTRIFAFGQFEVRSVNDGYNLENVVYREDFNNITNDYNNTCYASYFVELVNYFELENEDSKSVYRLLYYTFKALVKGAVPPKLIRRIFELKLLKYQGIYKESDKLLSKNETLIYTWDFVLNSNLEKLYSFKLSEEIFKLFDRELEFEIRENIDKKFKSLKFIEN